MGQPQTSLTEMAEEVEKLGPVVETHELDCLCETCARFMDLMSAIMDLMSAIHRGGEERK